MATQSLVRPAASEVRQMLQRIRLENIERAASSASGISKGGGPRGHQTFMTLPRSSSSKSLMFQNQMKAAGFSNPALNETGSFNSAPKVVPSTSVSNTDEDVYYPKGREELNQFLQRCAQHLPGLPSPIPRRWRKTPKYNNEKGLLSSNGLNPLHASGENIRILQWNVLSQSLGTKNDNFVRCPEAALDWRTRRFRMLEEIVRHDADVVCLQEVDHFKFLRKSLASLGYVGHFLPKPDSPCLYLAENTGPDGCAIFYKQDKYDMLHMDKKVVEIWRVQTNQVLLSMTLRSRQTGQEFVVSTTHLKARNGAFLATLRNEQGRDLVEHLSEYAAGKPIICTGDFNAEPTEPVYATMTKSDELRLSSAYTFAYAGKEPKYTTWKIREDGEHQEVLDYIFHSTDRIIVEAALELPTGEQIGQDRLPSLSYASDHFSLVADLKLLPAFATGGVKNQEKLV